MGQRSQIYVRYEGKLLIARYYQWNYAERMISRARYGMEYLQAHLEYPFLFKDSSFIHKLIRIFDTNFDMKDVQISSDIFLEYEQYATTEEYGFYEYVFRDQDNNDGKLLIDVADGIIKYAFLDHTADADHIMSAQDYMDWDDDVFWHRHNGNSDFVGKTCRDNINAIAELAQLMTKDEVENFIRTEDYFGNEMPNF